MKKLKNFRGILFLVFIAGFLLNACSGDVVGQNSVIESDFFQEKEKRILIIIGEGGPSGNMFVKSAQTFIRQYGGEAYEVHNGREFIDAFKDFLSRHDEIDQFVYFGHGNNVGLFVNQAPGVNASLYANDPVQNEGFLAASIYELSPDIFSKFGWIKFNGCNVAKGYPEQDSLAQRFANYFGVDTVAPMGPTEFSSDPAHVNPIPNTNYLDPSFDGDVYMVPTYQDQGFIVVEPQTQVDCGYVDVHEGQIYAEAVCELKERGLNMGKDGRFWPNFNISYGEALEFCRVAVSDSAKCHLKGFDENEKLRNLQALRMLADAVGMETSYTTPWYRSYIDQANNLGLLTEDFVNKKWYTRGEMAILARNFVDQFSEQ